LPVIHRKEWWGNGIGACEKATHMDFSDLVFAIGMQHFPDLA